MEKIGKDVRNITQIEAKKMKTINILGRKMPILAILTGLLIFGTASAATYFAFSGTINVTSPFGEHTDPGFNIDLKGGETVNTDSIELSNNADTPILVELETIVGAGTTFSGNDYTITYIDEDGIVLSDLDDDKMQELILAPGTTTYISATITTEASLFPQTYNINVNANAPEDVDFVGLTSKNNDWEPTHEETGMHGYVIYEKSSDEFDFCIKTVGLNGLIDYDLIYYEDFAPDRFDMWGGAENSMVIATVYPGAYVGFYGDEVGDDVVFFNSATHIGHNLPHTNDANADASWHDYRGAPDFYKTSTGAKLWLVPSGENINPDWNPDTYLFDNGLVNYTCTS